MGMKAKQLLQFMRKNPFFLAPMAGVTDSPFRSFMREMGCGIIITELVSAKSLQLENKMSQRLMAFTEEQHPLGVQIFGEDLEALSAGSQIVEQTGADFVDLNFGCPVPKIVKKGAGSAVLKDLSLLKSILKTVKKSVSIPVSIKVRTGWDAHSRNASEVAKIAHDEGIIWMAIHGRTRAQGYSGQADWNYIKKVKTKSPLPIIGNGDLKKPQQIQKLKKESQCDGMMIGRGALKNPYIFQEAHKAPNRGDTTGPCSVDRGSPHISSDFSHFTLQDKSYMKVLNRLKYHLENFYDERMFLLQYKKFSAWYSSGYPESARFRKEIFQCKNKAEILDKVESYFSSIDVQNQQDTAYTTSLMQGHG